ncbi:MAG: TSUP family transporter [Chitinophagaceae bacterium]|nr:TSUP family transporter [Chitinophagaceae bacterium]
MDITIEIILLCVVAFMAGFVDAIVGGGGLLQTPAGLILLPQYPVATIIGTLKIPAFAGTGFAAIQYARKVKIDYRILGSMAAIAFCAAFAGSSLLNAVSNRFMKPFLLIVLILVAIYTYGNKNFGIHSHKNHDSKQQWQYFILISLVIGFYDGFIGPGAGSFLVLAFIGLMGFDFLKASANAKFVNMATNLGSILFFIIKGKIIFPIALPMAICNALGGIAGARLAILKGNKFIRVFFLVIICGTILRFAYDVFFK